MSTAILPSDDLADCKFNQEALFAVTLCCVFLLFLDHLAKVPGMRAAAEHCWLINYPVFPVFRQVMKEEWSSRTIAASCCSV